MVVDPANAASIYATDRTQNLSSVNVSDDQKQNDIPQPENGQTSNVGPAVVTDLSAAALETSRAVAEGNQVADQNRSENNDNKKQTITAQAVAGGYVKSELDLMV